MLSIRTQDRMALVPYNGRIMISLREGVHEEGDWEFDTLFIVTPDGVYKFLGTYKTNERALEVLDEIQAHSLGNDTIRYEYFIGFDGTEQIEYTYKYKSVYEMPKK